MEPRGIDPEGGGGGKGGEEGEVEGSIEGGKEGAIPCKGGEGVGVRRG